MKRLFDMILSLSGLFILSPIFVIVSILIKSSSKGPLVFIQKRIGKHGRVFNAVKFRTMYTDSEDRGSITSSVDKRITPVGRILRRYKLDELPQLVNVLFGNMSFVGPRPDVPGYADSLTGEERRLLELRPGITGPATIFFRNEEELLSRAKDYKRYNDKVIWPAKVKINLRYLENYSIFSDIGYILITILPFVDNILGLMKKFNDIDITPPENFE